MNTLHKVNAFLIGITILCFGIIFLFTGLPRIVRGGGDDAIAFGFIPLAILILLVVYFILVVSFIGRNNVGNGIVTFSAWFNIILSTIGILLVLPFLYSYFTSTYEGFGIEIILAELLIGFSTVLTFICLLFGKRKLS